MLDKATSHRNIKNAIECNVCTKHGIHWQSKVLKYIDTISIDSSQEERLQKLDNITKTLEFEKSKTELEILKSMKEDLFKGKSVTILVQKSSVDMIQWCDENFFVLVDSNSKGPETQVVFSFLENRIEYFKVFSRATSDIYIGVRK